MRGITLVQGSIRKKLILTYSTVIFVFLAIIGVLLNITARRYLEEVLEKNLYAEASVIEELYRERTELLLSSQKEINADDFRLLIREWFSDVRGISRLGFNANIALVMKRERSGMVIFTPGESSNEENFKKVNTAQIVDNLKQQPFFFRILAGETLYFSVSRPLNTAHVFNDRNRAWLVVYVPVNEVSRLVTEMNIKALFAILVALLWAGAFTYYFSGHLSKPIKTLKEHANRIAGRDFKSRVSFKTGDEIESLAEAMNRIAGDLSEYDQNQKKLISNISHELKTPVMSIMGYAEGLLDDVITDREKALNVIVDECHRLKRMIDEVMFLSKLETLESFYTFAPHSLNGLIGECCEKMAVLISNADLALDLALGEDAVLRLDRDKIVQALMNLISNALRYARKTIRITTRHEDAWVHLFVEDDGEGIEAHDLPHIFERFYKGAKGNTGLGMTIVKAIAEGHGGTVSAGKSGALGGALFKLSIPTK
mgnify:CR=1 FL=1